MFRFRGVGHQGNDLYSYQCEARGMELLVASEDEIIKIDHREPVDACRLRMLRSEEKVMAVIWGLRDGL